MGKWIMTSERQPAEYGKYRVLRRAGTKYRAEDVYLWNGGYWVTRCGNPTKSVQCWWEGDGKPEAEVTESCTKD